MRKKKTPAEGRGRGRKCRGRDGRRPGGARHRRRRTQFAGAARRAAACGRRGRAPVSRRHRKAPGRGGREMRCPLPHGLVQGASDGRRPGGAQHRRRRTQFAGAARRAAACGRMVRASYPAGMEKPPAMRSGVVCTVIPPAAHPWGGSPDRRGSKGYRPDGR